MASSKVLMDILYLIVFPDRVFCRNFYSYIRRLCHDRSDTILNTGKQKRCIPWRKLCQYGILAFLILLAAALVKSFLDGPFQLHRKLSGIYRQLRHVRSAYSDFCPAGSGGASHSPRCGGYAAGAVLFGWAGGFFCNYIGISIGSLLAFYLARRYGAAFVQRHVSSAAYDKYFHWTQKKGFLWFLILTIFLPVAPDDLICFLAGLTAISAKKFCVIILALKPWCLLLYSLFFANLIQWDFIQNLIG